MESPYPNVIALWEKGVQIRSNYLERARQCSELTIPSLYVRNEASGGSDIPVPYQSVGAEGVRTLSSKLVLELLPLQSPFFRLEHGQDETRMKAKDRNKLRALMGLFERAVQVEIEKLGIRQKAPEAFQYLLVGGPALFDLRKKGVRVHRFENFIIQKDGRNNLSLLIVKERPSIEDLYKHFDVESQAEAHARLDNELGVSSEHQGAALYTVLERTETGDYRTYQIVCGAESERKKEGGLLIPGSKETYSKSKPPPWILVGYKWLDGENYPRSFCEELIGDLDFLDQMRRGLIEGFGVAVASNKLLVDPAGLTDADDITDSEPGATVPGREQDVHWLSQEGRLVDLNAARQIVAEAESNLQRQFLMFEGVRREGERVTAFETQQSTIQLDQAFGGFYSSASEQFHKPLAMIVLSQMMESGDYDDLFNELEVLGIKVFPKIVAGIDALSKGQELNKVGFAMQTVLTTLPPEQVIDYIGVGDFLDFSFNHVGLPRPPFLRSEEEVQAIRDARAQQEAAIRSAPNLVNAQAQLATQ